MKESNGDWAYWTAAKNELWLFQAGGAGRSIDEYSTNTRSKNEIRRSLADFHATANACGFSLHPVILHKDATASRPS